MLFGIPSQFAVEALLEPGPEYGPVWGSNIAGRIRVWMGGQPIGRFDEPSCALGPPCEHLVDLASQLHNLWDDSLDGLTHDEIFDRLDYLNFAAHRDRCLSDDWDDETWTRVLEEGKTFHRFNFLLHSSEAFDGWKAFLVCPRDSNPTALVLPGDSPDILVLSFPASTYRQAVHAFASWRGAQERLLIPHLFDRTPPPRDEP